MSFNVLLIPEDPVKDGYVLKPIIEAMMRAVGKPQARVVVCVDPRFHGTSQALRWQFIQQALSRNAGMFHLYLLCVDRDGDLERFSDALLAPRLSPPLPPLRKGGKDGGVWSFFPPCEGGTQGGVSSASVLCQVRHPRD